jgi:hypothetical protein
MTDAEKFWAALNTVRADTKCFVNGKVLTEENFNNNIQWETGVDSNGMAITTSTCPHSEITWAKVKTEMDKL